MSTLELIQMPSEGGKDYEQVFKVMFSHSEAWLPLLSALHPKSRLLEHPSVKVVLDALQWLTNPQQRQQLRVDFFLNLKDGDVNLLAKFCALVSQEESTIQQVIVDEWITQLSLFRKNAQTFERRVIGERCT